MYIINVLCEPRLNEAHGHLCFASWEHFKHFESFTVRLKTFKGFLGVESNKKNFIVFHVDFIARGPTKMNSRSISFAWHFSSILQQDTFMKHIYVAELTGAFIWYIQQVCVVCSRCLLLHFKHLVKRFAYFIRFYQSLLNVAWMVCIAGAYSNKLRFFYISILKSYSFEIFYELYQVNMNKRLINLQNLYYSCFNNHWRRKKSQLKKISI